RSASSRIRSSAPSDGLTTRVRACLELAVAMALVGSSVVVGKLLVAHLPVFLISGIRFAIASLILVPLALLAARGVPAIGARDLGVMALQAASRMFAFNALLLAGLALTSAAEGGIVTCTTPAVAVAACITLLGCLMFAPLALRDARSHAARSRRLVCARLLRRGGDRGGLPAMGPRRSRSRSDHGGRLHGCAAGERGDALVRGPRRAVSLEPHDRWRLRRVGNPPGRARPLNTDRRGRTVCVGGAQSGCRRVRRRRG